MNNLITSESDIELDPTSLIDTEELNLNQKNINALKDLDNLINDLEKNNYLVSNISVPANTKINKPAKCAITIENDRTKKSFYGVYNISEMNQPSYRNHTLELTIDGAENKIIGLFSFFQRNVLAHLQSRPSRSLTLRNLRKSGKNKISKKIRMTFAKFDLLQGKKKINLLNQKMWIITEVKYFYEKDKSNLKLYVIQK